MRIGQNVIDTDNMSIEECTIIINEMRSIRARKKKAQELVNRMNDLMNEAKENGFAFIGAYYETKVVTFDNITLYDEKA